MKNSYKVVSLILFGLFSAVSAMDRLSDAEKRALGEEAADMRYLLLQAPALLNPAEVVQLQSFCVAQGHQRTNYRIQQATGQAINKQKIDRRNAAFGHRPVYRNLTMPSSSSSSSSSSSDSE